MSIHLPIPRPDGAPIEGEILGPCVQFVGRPHPFRTDRILLDLEPGASIAEILARAGFHPRVLPFTQVAIGTDPVPADWWGRVRPKAGTVVYARVVPGKKGKNPLGMLLMVAVAVLSVWTGGLAAGAFAAAYGAGAAATAVGAIVSAAVSMVGRLLVNAIAPPPKPKNNAPGLSRGTETFGITGIRNQSNPFGPVPEFFGRMRIFPPFAAQPYTEIAGDDQILRCLFDLGRGPFTLTDIKIGDTPLTNYSGVSYEIRDLGAGEAMPTIYTNDVEEDALNIELKFDEDPRILVSRVATDEISLDFSFPAMYFIDSAGEQHGVRVEIVIDYRLVGSSDWINLTPLASNSITLANWDEAAYLAANPDVRAGWQNVGLGPRGWTHWQVNGRNEGRRPFVLANGAHAFSEFSTEPKRFGIHWKTGAPGQYEVRLTRMTPAAVQGFEGQTQSDSFVTALRSFHHRPPVKNQGQVLFALRITASGQLNGIVDQLNMIAQRWLPVWTGTGWVTEETRSPAWAYVYALRQGVSRSVADSRLQLDDLKAWADACAPATPGGEPRRTFDARVDARATLFEFLREVASCGRAAFGMRDGRFSIVRDVAQTVPVQVFTPRNSWAFRWSRTFADLPHALKVKFLDPDKGYEPAEAVVYNDGYDETSASVFESLEPFGCARASQAISDGRFYFAHAKLRPESYELTADFENLACTRGDLVQIGHDVIRAGLGFGRIRALLMDGGSVAGVELDDPVAMAADGAYALRVRRSVGGPVLASVVTAAGEQTTLMFQAPLSPFFAPAEGDLFTFGEALRVDLAAIVKEIRPGPDLTATLVLLPAAPELHALDGQPIPDYVPPVSYRPAAVPAAVLDLAITEEVIYAGGFALTRPVVTWRGAPGQYAAGFEVYERLGDTPSGEPVWRLVEVTKGQRHAFGPRGRGSPIEVAVLAVSSTGAKLDLTRAATVAHVMAGPLLPPADVSRFLHDITGAGRHRFTWLMPQTRPNFAGVRFRIQAGQGRDWLSAVGLHDGLVTQSPYEVEALPSGTWTVLVKAVDTDGLESAGVAAITLGLGDPLAENVIETVSEAPAWTGTKTACAISGADLLADDPGGFMYAADTSAFYRVTDDQPMFGADAAALYPADDLPMFTADNADMYSVVFAAMSYGQAFTPVAPGALVAIAEGDGAIGLWLRRIFPDPMFSIDGEDVYGPDDGAAFYDSAAEAFAPLVAGTRVDRQPFEIEARIGAGTTRGRLGRLDIVMDAIDVVERFDDVAVPAEGLRLTPTKQLIRLKNVSLTLQDDGGTATSAKIVAKNETGAFIQCFDAAGIAVPGVVDAITQGY